MSVESSHFLLGQHKCAMVDKRTKSVIQIVRGKSCWRDSDRNGPKAVAICPNIEEPSGFIF